MASTIKIKRSNVAGKTPTTSDISAGELAINIKDQKLYSSNGTAVFQISGSSSGGEYANATVTRVKASDLNINSFVVTSVTGVLIGATAPAYLQVANAVATYTTKVNPTTSALWAHNGRATISTNLAVSGNTSIIGLLANNSLGTSNQVLKTNGSSVYWGAAASASSNSFTGILVGSNVVVADSTTDRLTFVAGSGMSIAANPTTDTITFSSTASGSSAFDYGTAYALKSISF